MKNISLKIAIKFLINYEKIVYNKNSKQNDHSISFYNKINCLESFMGRLTDSFIRQIDIEQSILMANRHIDTFLKASCLSTGTPSYLVPPINYTNNFFLNYLTGVLNEMKLFQRQLSYQRKKYLKKIEN